MADMMKAFGGVGSRQTPPPILTLMTSIATRLAAMGWTLRSGAARGADTAFEEGAISVGGAMEIYLPEPGWNLRPNRPPYIMKPTREACAIAERYHPAWHLVKPNARALHARNSHQVLGADCATPARFLLCWTPDGACADRPPMRATGGTGQAIRVAIAYGIPVFNLRDPVVVERVERMVTR